MRVFRGIPKLGAQPCVLTIGNFDGVHLGHKALLQRLRERARSLGLPAAVLTFEPLPREFFAPASAPPRLAGIRRKLALLQEAGIDDVYVQRFDARFAALDAQQFIDQILVRGLHTRYLMIGDDFCFGRGRSGNFATLQEAGALRGFQVEAMHTLEVQGERASSSAVREALQKGEIEHATRLLGEPFALEGRVMHGDKIGRTLGFPTANIQLRQPSLPLSGIFAVTVDGGPLQDAIGAASVGVRPTIGDKLALRLEVFVMDFEGDLYHQRLKLSFHHKIRDEAKYDGLDELKAAIRRDCDEVRAFFAAQSSLTR
ncbi:bifunctional riboflavin kinase/FAD synthetase [Uliginosibacterium sp. H1]|uniref:bifunctional riboflavin kinase/FAD synthetase n=1 Tax=Uliginosibacterium sp. H1 TaxID=3114757 RepID=UPI002E175D0F|nr:bifunctional riboflavin kinase/FAD synthetase [Uliginosibacterium sp. H1]